MPEGDWKCGRCNAILPSENGKEPTACHQEQGGCGRPADETRFWKANATEAEIAAILYHETGDASVLGDTGLRDGKALFYEVVSELERLLVFAHPAISRFVAVFIFQTYFRDIITNAFYLGIVGTKGTGKTTVLEIIRELSWRGQVVGPGSSPAAIARTLNEGSTLCIDEIDEMPREAKDLCYAILRQGYRKNSSNILKWDMAAKKKEVINPFGPKAVSFRGDIDDALASRMYKVPSVQLQGDFVDRVMDNMVRREETLKTKIEAFSKLRRTEENWSSERVDNVLVDPDFRHDVRATLPKGGTPRDAELATMFMVISKIIGIDLIDELQRVMSAQKDLESESESDLGEVVKLLWEDSGKAPSINIKELRNKVNDFQKIQGDKHIGPERFRRYLRDPPLLCRDGVEIRRKPGDGRYFLYFTPELQQRLLSPTTSQNETVSSLFAFETSHSDSEVTGGVVNSQRERVNLLRAKGEKLIETKEALGMVDGHTHKSNFTLEELAEQVVINGVDIHEVEAWIVVEKREGRLMEPRDGEFRFI